MPDLEGVPAWGIFTIAVVVAVFAGVERVLKLRGKGGDDSALSKVESRQLAELHAWHDRHDDDGVPIWYIKTDLKRAIETQTLILERMVAQGEYAVKTLEAIVKHQEQHTLEHKAMIEAAAICVEESRGPVTPPPLRDAGGVGR